MDPIRGTGRAFPSAFTPPSATATPGALFPPGIGHDAVPKVFRFIRRDDAKQILIYAGGACLDEDGQADAPAAWSFVFQPTLHGRLGALSDTLEKQGPYGDEAPTRDRATLRAVVGALHSHAWDDEGFTTVVLAVDSDYVAEGATVGIRRWLRNGWQTSTGEAVENKDMWEMILGIIEELDRRGVDVQFWRITPELNATATRTAKATAAAAAAKEKSPTKNDNTSGELA
ncbi:hypothetical protein RJ55_06693 [Drechmeria coniospora]|nr:hypothetical protein RJ55_06693 [Drechmeria coniospora]